MKGTHTLVSDSTAEVSRIPKRLRHDWDDILRPTSDAEPFDPATTTPLPGAAQRWLAHAIAPGTPLRRRVLLDQHGQLKLGGRWSPFTARQALDPLHGFVWPVTTRVLGLPVIGFDRLSRGSAEMRHRLLGLVTVASGRGQDFLRSAAARPASEICWTPAAALDPRVRWREGSETRATAVVPLAGHEHEVTLTLEDDGTLRAVTVPRWVSLDGGPWQLLTFGARVLEEATFGGFTVPVRVVAGYGEGEMSWHDGAFIRLTVDSAAYL